MPQSIKHCTEYMPRCNMHRMFLYPVARSKVLLTTYNLKAKFSQDCDGISTKMLKKTISNILQPIIHMINIYFVWYWFCSTESSFNDLYIKKERLERKISNILWHLHIWKWKYHIAHVNKRIVLNQTSKTHISYKLLESSVFFSVTFPYILWNIGMGKL